MKWWLGYALLGVFALAPSSACGQEISEHRPVFSPDGQHVVFMLQSDGTGQDWELYLVDPNGGEPKRLTHSVGWDGYAVFSPDGDRLVFDRSSDGTSGAKLPHMLELHTGGVSPLGTYDGWLSVSDWSEEHGLLAFWERDGQRDLYLLDETGDVVRQLTRTPHLSEHDAHFSPDGTEIVFASGPAVGEGRTTLELMESTGSDRRVLVESPGRLYGADWSPDGQRIAFSDAPDGENGDVFVVSVPSGEVERLTDHEAWDHMPVWSASGDRILFTSYRGGSERMYWLDPATRHVEAWVVGSDRGRGRDHEERHGNRFRGRLHRVVLRCGHPLLSAIAATSPTLSGTGRGGRV